MFIFKSIYLGKKCLIKLRSAVMISFTISDIKKTMNLILKGTTFDGFEVRGLEIQTYSKFEISGILDKDFIDLPEEEKKSSPNYVTWGKLKPIALEIIKGSRSPKGIKIIFSLPEDQIERYTAEASALFINFIFKDKIIMVSTGSAMKNFTLNRQYDQPWDEYVQNFFKSQEISIDM